MLRVKTLGTSFGSGTRISSLPNAQSGEPHLPFCDKSQAGFSASGCNTFCRQVSGPGTIRFPTRTRSLLLINRPHQAAISVPAWLGDPEKEGFQLFGAHANEEPISRRHSTSRPCHFNFQLINPGRCFNPLGLCHPRRGPCGFDVLDFHFTLAPARTANDIQG